MLESTYKYSSEDKDLCPPLTIFINPETINCRDLRKNIFGYVFDLIEQPDELKELLKDKTDQAERLETAFKYCFEESKFGAEHLYTLKIGKRKFSYNSIPVDKEFKEADLSFKDFLVQ